MDLSAISVLASKLRVFSGSSFLNHVVSVSCIVAVGIRESSDSYLVSTTGFGDLKTAFPLRIDVYWASLFIRLVYLLSSFVSTSSLISLEIP